MTSDIVASVISRSVIFWFSAVIACERNIAFTQPHLVGLLTHDILNCQQTSHSLNRILPRFVDLVTHDTVKCTVFHVDRPHLSYTTNEAFVQLFKSCSQIYAIIKQSMHTLNSFKKKSNTADSLYSKNILNRPKHTNSSKQHLSNGTLLLLCTLLNLFECFDVKQPDGQLTN